MIGMADFSDLALTIGLGAGSIWLAGAAVIRLIGGHAGH
jgi:hypothetical protein